MSYFTFIYYIWIFFFFFFFSSRRRHTRLQGDWSSDVCSSDLSLVGPAPPRQPGLSTIGRLSAEPVNIAAPPQSGGRERPRNGGFDTRIRWFDRSEERRVGEEGRSRGAPDHLKKKKEKKRKERR